MNVWWKWTIDIWPPDPRLDIGFDQHRIGIDLDRTEGDTRQPMDWTGTPPGAAHVETDPKCLTQFLTSSRTESIDHHGGHMKGLGNI